MEKNLLIRTLIWLAGWKQISCGLLLCLVVVSALGVTLAAHQTRQIYSRLQVIGLRSDDLDSEYEKLLLEQSAWADYIRVDQVSRDELLMRPPDMKNMVVVKR